MANNIMHASKYWFDISTTITLLLLNIVKAKLRQIPGRDETWHIRTVIYDRQSRPLFFLSNYISP